MEMACDDNALTQALLDGAHEDVLWSSFLALLCRRTGADYSILLCQPPGWRQGDALQLISGTAPITDTRDIYRRHFVRRDPNTADTITEGQPYSLNELIRLDHGDHADFYTELTLHRGVTDIRHLRVREASGVDAWLTVVRKGGQFDPETDRLLEMLAPRLRSVMRSFVMLERERFTASLAEEAIQRLQFGWLAIDRDGRVVDSDRVGEAMLRESGIISRTASGRLRVSDPRVQREVLAFVKGMATDPDARPRAVSLSSDPWLDMLLVVAPQRLLGSIGQPAVVAYVHGDSWRAADRCQQLIDMFRLSPSEAHLALELCRGRSIADVACDRGLRVDTVRGYSKSIYAKIGVKGQVDLVRILMGSVLALANDHHGRAFTRGLSIPTGLEAEPAA